jgi:hypothetical protein
VLELAVGARAAERVTTSREEDWVHEDQVACGADDVHPKEKV